MNELAKKINWEIKQRGTISFARFMELALYCPVFGYYEKESDTIGHRGDFYTNVSVGSLFGQLLGWQFAEWLEEILTEKGARVVEHVMVVEAGAHRGDLANDILDWVRIWRPGLFKLLDYWIVEPSELRQSFQRRTLAEFEEKVRWASNLEELRTNRESGICGIIFSNELLDSFPVHRLRWNAKQRSWVEWGVTLESGRFVWTQMPEHTPNNNWPHVPNHHGLTIPEELLAHLPEQFTIDISPAAERWWHNAARLLTRGKLLTIDYGLTTEELILTNSGSGRLRAYQKHHLSENLLACPGEQDLTTHINFSVIKHAGEIAGLSTEAFSSQEQFLTPIAARFWKTQSYRKELSQIHARQFLTLTHPEHLGRRFRVLIQARG